MKKLCLIFSFVIFITIPIFGQSIDATTTDGKRVVLNSDGTWKYYEMTIVEKVNPTDCSSLIRTETDKVTGKTMTGTKDPIIVSADDGKTGLAIYLLLGSSNNLIFTMTAYGAGNCIDEGDKINILFTDGSRLELANDSKFNCDREATLYFGGVFGKKNQLNQLKTKKIQTMRVWTSDSYVERDFTPENQDEFYNAINCLMK